MLHEVVDAVRIVYGSGVRRNRIITGRTDELVGGPETVLHNAGTIVEAAPDGVQPATFIGCSKRVVATFPTAPELIVNPTALPDGGPTVPLTDSRYTTVVAAWSACMTRAGYAYASPLDPPENGRWDNADAHTTRVMIDTATADMKCKVDTNLVGVGTALQTAYDARYIQYHRAEIDAQSQQIEQFINSN